MNTSSGYDNLHDESPIEDRQRRKDSTRDLNGSYILACRGVESLENSEADYQPKVVSPHVYSHVHHKLSKDCTIYTSIALDDSDDHCGETKPGRRITPTRILHDSAADKSLPNPANVSSGEFPLLCNSIAEHSTLPNPESDSDAPLCRICHEGDEEEDLVSPCFCSGTVGALHMSCLEQWLGASDKTRCEICEFQFSIAKRPKPVKWYMKNKALGHERRYMIADIACAVCFTPLTIGCVTGCMVGAQYFTSVDKDWQATTLILVAMTVLLVFLLWCWFAARRNYILCASWRENFQEIKIKYNPPDKNNNKPTFSRGCSITERMLLESSFPQIPANKISPENLQKHGARIVTYDTSPRHNSTKIQCDDAENSTLKPGTPYPKRKNSSKTKHTGNNSHKAIELKEVNKKPHTAIEQECQHNLRKGRVDAIRNASTSTPAMVNIKSNKHNIFDENTCSATPIQCTPYEAMPIHNLHPELMCGNPVLVEDRPGMFVETPYTFVQTNMAARSMARRGLVFQQAPIAAQESDGLSSTTSQEKISEKISIK